ncbi:MAG TPA: hypothetical protein VNW73_16570, partial [Ktedonobacteraceae bacterium]|nr:hypothetical protein [Ktedonobacteraceae bacterium]
CTGAHGANRLASNSLLEGLVFGLHLADGLAGINGKQTEAPSRQAYTIPVYDDLSRDEALLSVSLDHESIVEMRREIRKVMWKFVSLQRDREGLLEATQNLHNLRTSMHTNGSTRQNNVVEWRETVNMLKVADLVTAAALQRCESRGSHSRLDCPVQSDLLTGRHYVFQPVLDGISQQITMPQGVTSKTTQDGRKGTSLLYYEGDGDSSMCMVEERGEVIFNG